MFGVPVAVEEGKSLSALKRQIVGLGIGPTDVAMMQEAPEYPRMAFGRGK